MLFTLRHIHLLFIPNYSPSLILSPRVNEVGVRGRENRGLMDLIKGVALTIGGETTRYGAREEVRQRQREAGEQHRCLCSQWQGALVRTETEEAEKGREWTGKKDGGEC